MIIKKLNKALRYIPILFFVLFGITPPLYSQDEQMESGDEKNILNNLDSLRIAKYEGKNIKFTPFIAPSYSPELQFLISAGGLLTFSLQKENPLLTRSSIPFSFGYSSNGSITGNFKATLYGRNDSWRLTGDFWIKDMSDHYWGVGYQNGLVTPQSDSTTLYHRNWFKVIAKLGIKIRKNLYLGPILDVNQTIASDINPRMADDPDYLLTGPVSRNTGLGIILQYDSRDFAVNAYKGLLLDLNYIRFTEILGGENTFGVLELDYRQYVELRKRHILAWELRSRFASGDSPWTEKSMIGSPWDLRGYYWGRFRDDYMNFILVEYRHMFNRKKPNKKNSFASRSGVVFWTGHGVIAPDWKHDIDWIPNLGIGYRFEVQPRMNLRVDYGVGKESSAIYFSFNEAF